ncbi:hypothetical protein [Streptomyces sp. SID8352]|uniref:hypothetical protein n=1 Tax=Streptomyces sp. SID8352 TaxID=2690338 RepID=UPI00136D2D3A|nr:hypothetical protein [Streptomyces sp. SID8352]MYU25318.1 hypothetical protein [Streptomyces sp. SID8352]
MRAIPVASAALLGAGVLAACAPAGAVVGGITPFGFSVQPSTVAPGGTVTLRVDREDGRCESRVTVSSPVFDTVTIPRRQSTATAVVDREAEPGAVYQVAFTCDGRTGTTRLTIAGGGHHTRHPGPVRAGEGGSAGGFDLQRIGIGAALIAGAVGTAYHFARRRSATEAGGRHG